MNINIAVSNFKKSKYAKNEFKITRKMTNYSKTQKLSTIHICFFKIVITIRVGDINLWYY